MFTALKSLILITILAMSMHYQQPEILAENGRVSLVRSSVTGIVDVYLAGDLNNNMLIATDVYNGDFDNVNFSDISAVYPEVIEQPSPDSVRLRYSFPNGARIEVLYQVRTSYPQIVATLTVLPDSPTLRYVGIVNSLGVRYNLDHILVDGSRVYTCEDFKPLPPLADYGLAGHFRATLPPTHSIQSYNRINGHSVYQAVDERAESRFECRDVAYFKEQESWTPRDGHWWFDMVTLLFREAPPGKSFKIYMGVR